MLFYHNPCFIDSLGFIIYLTIKERVYQRMVKKRDQQGFLILAAIVLIVVVGAFMAALTYMFVGSTRSGADHLASMKAFYIAQAGLERGRYAINSPFIASPPTPIDARKQCANINSTEKFGSGQFSVVGTFFLPTSSTLSSGITNAVTTIPLASVTGYSTEGIVTIDSEMLYYTGISGTSLTGAQRGQNGTAAAAHSSGATVSQNMCQLVSTGAVPSLAAPQGQRVVKAFIPGPDQSGFLVGQVATTPLVGQWTGSVWNRMTTSVSQSRDLLGIDMISSLDGWAVGAPYTSGVNNGKAYIVHYNTGTNTWIDTGFTNSVTSTVNLNDVDCMSGTECWAVGDVSGGAFFLAHYTPTSWVTTGFTVTVGNHNGKILNINALTCPDNTVCWAGGEPATTGSSGNRTPLIIKYTPGTTTWADTGVTNNVTTGRSINGITCLDASTCWAVGSVTGTATLFAKYTSGTTTWADSGFTVNVKVPTNIPLRDVTCTSATNCWAVGDLNGSHALIVHYQNTPPQEWTTVGVTNNSPAQALYSVACYNANDCWASGAAGTLVHWNGVSWDAFTAPNIPTTGILYDVSLLSKTTVGTNKFVWREDFHHY